MRVTVNGREEQVEPGTTVAALVTRYHLQPKHVAIEINRDLVPRRTFEERLLCDGDHVEIVTLVGGG